jgi:hypothetical protein
MAIILAPPATGAVTGETINSLVTLGLGIILPPYNQQKSAERI